MTQGRIELSQPTLNPATSFSGRKIAGSKLRLEYKLLKVNDLLLLPCPHLIRDVDFVLQLQPGPGCEALDHVLCLCRGQLLQESHALLDLRAAQRTPHQYDTDTQRETTIHLLNSQFQTDGPHLSLSNQLEEIQVINLRHWELICLS